MKPKIIASPGSNPLPWAPPCEDVRFAPSREGAQLVKRLGGAWPERRKEGEDERCWQKEEREKE
jgi:hypothetical protein